MTTIALFVSAIVGFGERDGHPNAESLVATPPLSQSQIWGSPRGMWTIQDVKADEPVSAAPVEAAPAPPAAPTPEPWATMVVRSGDSFNSLAEWFGITGESIASINGVGLDYIFHPGDTLVIPIPASQFLMPPELPVYVYEEPVIEEEPVYVEPESTPEPTAAPAPPPAARTSSQADVIAAICSLPWNCDTMVRIASCESGLNPNSYNPAGYYGIFQISGVFDGWNDPWINARVAYQQKYLPALAHGGDGLSPWPHCRHY